MKSYTDALLAKDILLMIKHNYSVEDIAKWALEIHLKSKDELSSKGKDALMTLIVMDQGPEFYLSQKALESLANSLLVSGSHS